MTTDSITIGRDPSLTMAIVAAIARRRERNARRAAWIARLTFWKR